MSIYMGTRIKLLGDKQKEALTVNTLFRAYTVIDDHHHPHDYLGQAKNAHF